LYQIFYRDDDANIDKDESEKIVQNALSSCKAIDALQEINAGMPKRKFSSGNRWIESNTNSEYRFRNIVSIKIIGAENK
jgi:hypothetical protein